MKTINKIFALVLLGGMVSCQDATDIVQDGTITDDLVFENVTDLQFGLNGAYGAYSGENVINFNALFTDNLKRGIDNNGQGQEVYNFVLNSSTGEAGGIWLNRYSTINRINRVLNGVAKIEPETTADQETEDHIAGQMYALRALAHLDVVEYYTPDYQDPNSLSAVYMDFVPDNIDIEPVRNTASEMYDFIEKDLDRADSLLSSTIGSSFYINQNTVKAIRTNLALVKGDYATAGTLADELLAAYPLADQTQYVNVFQDIDDVGVIFKLARGLGEAQVASLFYFNEVSIDGAPYLEMSNELFNLLDPNDVRFDVLVNPGSVIVGLNSPENILLINKYPGSEEVLGNDIKIYRAAEMLLIRAEAEARAGQLGNAAASIKELRDVRFGSSQPLPVYGNLEDALRDILLERRIELAYEGQRYLDLKRIGGDLNIGVTRNPVDCASFNAQCALPRNDYRFTLPIPQSELNANTKIQRNPGYN